MSELTLLKKHEEDLRHLEILLNLVMQGKEEFHEFQNRLDLITYLKERVLQLHSFELTGKDVYFDEKEKN